MRRRTKGDQPVADERVIPVGVLTPHAAAGPEIELPDMAPGRVATLLSRIRAPGCDASASGTPPTTPTGLRSLTEPSALDEATAAFAGGSVDVIGHASTSTGYALGFDTEVAVLERLSQRWGLPVVGTSVSAVLALQALHVHRVALIHPPWFDDGMNELGAAYFRSQGFEVVSSESADLANDPERIDLGAMVEWICGHLGDEAESVFIGGNGFRGARAVEALEGRLGRPVLESNQVLLWSVLAETHAGFEIRGFGRIFGLR
jgi:maleate isomerase